MIRVRNISLHQSFQTNTVAYKGSYSVGTGAFFPGENRPGREANHLKPYNARAENEQNCASTATYALMARTGLPLFSEVNIFKRKLFCSHLREIY
jgi:hypothetical protein